MRAFSAGAGVLIFFAVFWSAVTLTCDGVIGSMIYRQKRAESFASTTGRITRSEIRSSYDSDGTTYHAEVEFDYEVDGRKYHGDRYRFSGIGTSDFSVQQGVIDQYPIGAVVDVFYDPADPATAVLEKGVGGTDMFLLLFMTPFNIVMIFLWAFAGVALWRRIRKPPAGGVRIFQRAIGTVVRLPRFPPLAAAGGTALLVSFVGIFIVGFGTNMQPSMTLIRVIWIIVIGSAAAVLIWRTYVVGSGAKDLIIDDGNRAMSLPQSFGRKEDIIVPFGAVEAVRVERIEHRGREGGSTYTYAPTIDWRGDDASKKSDRLAEWYDETRAAAFTDWLRKRIGQE